MEKKDKGTLLSKPISYIVFGFIGFLFLFFTLTGRDLAEKGNIIWDGKYVLRTCGVSLAAGGAIGAAFCFLCRRLAELGENGESGGDGKPGENGESGGDGKPGGSGESAGMESRWNWRGADLKRYWAWLWRRASGAKASRVFGFSLCLILLAWFPGFLAYYPAICAYDAPIQTGQIVENFYIDHHPIAHTLLIKWAMMLGEGVFGNVNTGIGVYALLQMAFLAAAFAFGVSRLQRRGIRRVWLVMVQLFCMLYPFNLYMSVSVTKDTVFSGFFVFQILALCEIIDAGDMHFSKMEFLFFFSTVGMILFRNNGMYAFLVYLVCLVFVFIFGKKQRIFWGKLFALSLGAFLAGGIMLTVVFKATNASQGDKREMLSIPIQQLARVMVYHGGVGVLEEDDGTMEEVDRALINDFILYEGYRNYRPDFADPVKSNTNTYVARYRTGDFVSTYLRLLRRYPGDFINAFLAVDAGYLYPGDVSHAYVNAQEGQAAGGGYVQTRWDEATLNARGIYKDTRWRGLFEGMEKWADENAYFRLPALKYLFVPGTVIWAYLLLFGWRLLRREFKRCMPFMLVFGYFLTLLLGPTVQLRYIYPIMIVFPFMMLWRHEKKF